MLLLPATVTSDEAGDTLRMLAQGLAREPDAGVVIGAGALQRFDSALLAVLLECRRLADASGRHFSVRDVPPKLLKLARVYGVAPLLFPDAARSGETATA